MDMNAIVEEIYSAIQYHGLIKTLYALFQKSVKIEIGYTQKCCEVPIEELYYPTRCYNALKRAKINTVGEVVTAINEDKLLYIRQLGLKSRSEIRVITCEFGYERLSEWQKKEFIRNTIKKYKGAI